MNKIIALFIFLFFSTNCYAISPENTIEQLVSKLKNTNDLSVIADYYNWRTSRVDKNTTISKLRNNGREKLEKYRVISSKSGDTEKLAKVEAEYADKLNLFNERITKASFSYKILSRAEGSVVMEITRSIDSEKVTKSLDMYDNGNIWIFDDLSIFNLNAGEGSAPFGDTINPLNAVRRQ